MKKAAFALVTSYSLIVIGLMFLLPMNRFEWMLAEPGGQFDAMSFCGLPPDDDINLRHLILLFCSPLLLLGLIHWARCRRADFLICIALAPLPVWVWRYFLHYPVC